VSLDSDPPVPNESPPEDQEQLKPSAMRGNETVYGYVVLLELVAVAVINLTVTHGAGAPKHSQTMVSAVGLAAAAIYGGTLQTRNRFIVGFTAILAAFVVSIPQVPNSVKLYHIFGLAIPLVYALILTQRQRKAATALIRSGKAAPARTTEDRRAAALARRQERKRGRAGSAPSGPAASRRYTPPKAKRPRR
jgi:hypothetical protein